MTKEAFLEELLDHGHQAWAAKEQGKQVDLRVFLGRKNKATGEAREPTFDLNVRKEGH